MEITILHVYKPKVDYVKEVVEYYIKKYKKPVWISEIACVKVGSDFSGCTDQDTIDTFVSDVVEYFEGNDDVVAYSLIWNGAQLGQAWPIADDDGQLFATGKAYLNALK